MRAHHNLEKKHVHSRLLMNDGQQLPTCMLLTLRQLRARYYLLGKNNQFLFFKSRLLLTNICGS
jgi:hypothetical protein